MNRDDVIDVLSVVAAATRRSTGGTDADVWQAVIGDLPKELALRAVREHLRDRPGVWLEPGHIYQRVRAILREQLAREPDAMREARQESLAVKAAEDAAELAERKGIPGPVKFKRHAAQHLAIKCPWCHAGVGQPCVVPQTGRRPADGVHPSRREAAEVNA